MNFLEQLTAEWLEYRGYFVRRNVQVGKSDEGGLESELAVVAFHPGTNHLVHVEPSMEASTRQVRSHRYENKFTAGRTHIPTMFASIATVRDIDQVALFGFGTRLATSAIAGGRIIFVDELITEIRQTLRDLPSLRRAVSERFVCLRTIQFTLQSEVRVREGVEPGLPLVRPDTRTGRAGTGR